MLNRNSTKFSKLIVSPPGESEIVGLSDYILDDMAMDVRQPSLRSVVVKRQAFVIKTKKMQDRRVEVINGGDVLGRFPAKLVGRAPTKGSLHTGSCQKACKAGGIMIAT
jgi:hypothetical protein